MPLNLAISICQSDDCRSFTVADETGAYNSILNPGGYNAPNPVTSYSVIQTATISVTKFGDTTTYTTDVSSLFPNTDDTQLFTINNTNIGLGSTDNINDGIYQISYTITGGYTIGVVNTGTKTFTITGVNASSLFNVGDSFSILGSSGNDSTYTVAAISYSSSNTNITVNETVLSAVANGKILFIAQTSIYEMFFCSGMACYYQNLQSITGSECEECNDTKIEFLSKVLTFINAAKYAAQCGKVNKASALLDYITELCSLTSCSNCG